MTCGMLCASPQAKRSKFLKAHYTQWWPNHREYWRWIKDDNLARMIAYFFPCVAVTTHLIGSHSG